jgi:hypothetical protein
LSLSTLYNICVWKITILRQKIIFFPILGGARAGCAPPSPGSAPDVEGSYVWDPVAVINKKFNLIKAIKMHPVYTCTKNRHVRLINIGCFFQFHFFVTGDQILYNVDKDKQLKAYALPPLKLEKIWFFGVKSWFFTRNTPKFSRLPPLGAIFFNAPL